MSEQEQESGEVEAIIKPPVRPNSVVPSRDVEPEEEKGPQKPSKTELELREAERDFITGDQRTEECVRYGIYGKEVEERSPFFAKKITTHNTDGTESVKYQLALYNGSIYNPSGSFSRRNQRLQDFFTFKPCTESCFDDYVEYLKTGREQLYWKANRSILNG